MTSRWEVLGMKEGEILEDWHVGCVRAIIMRGPASLCAYLGVPEGHPLAEQDYDSIPLNCHGGLTFASKGEGRKKEHGWPEGYYWYGWDYSHCDDAAVYSFESYMLAIEPNPRGKQWTVKEVKDEVKDVLWDFKILCELAETITNKNITKT